MISKEDLRLAFLRVLDGATAPMSFVSIMRGLSKKMNLTCKDLSATLKYSGKRKFYMKAKHARSFLLKKNFVQKVAATDTVAGGCALTPDGKGFLAALR